MSPVNSRTALYAVASAALFLAIATRHGPTSVGMVDATRTSFPSFGPDTPRRYDVVHPSRLANSLQPNSFFSLGDSFADGQDIRPPALEQAIDVVLRHIERETGLTDEDVRVQNAYTSDHNGVTHVYLRQIVNGIHVVNADINVNVDRHGRVISMGESVYRGPKTGHDIPNTPEIEDELMEDDNTNEDVKKTSSQSSFTTAATTSLFVQDNNDDNDHSLWSLFKSIFPKLRDDHTSHHFTFTKSTKIHRQKLLRRSELWGVKSSDFHHDDNNDNDFSDSHGILTAKEALAAFSQHIHQEIQRPDLIKLVTHSSLRGPATTVLTNVPYALSPCPVRPAYIMVDNGRRLRLVWDIQTELRDAWYNSHIDARTGEVLQLVDWVSDAVPQGSNLLHDLPLDIGHSRVPPHLDDEDDEEGDAVASAYRIYPMGTNDPNDGDREFISNPANKLASPLGWHKVDKSHTYSDTQGNNVVASENHDGETGQWRRNHRPQGTMTKDGLTFDFPLSLKQDPDEYVDAAVTNLFYWNNMLHDLYYQYGFTEKAGNFQNNNLGRGGDGGDGVIASAQDGSGYNNANFATPPDGGHGKMRMYVWNVVKPYRDGDLEGGIITHEYTHGLSIRLTGGPDNSGCLGWGESGGMGEGWGDFVATWLRMRPETKRTTDFTMGEYANGGHGIRRYPYSTNMKTNPETFASMNKAGYWGVHAKGAVWAEMLYEMYWNLVDKHGFTTDIFSASKKYGNTLALQLVIDGMKLQPCRPNFSDARDAILLADQQLTNGENQCEIWKAFAKRGLGVGARLVGGTPWGGGKRQESAQVPDECR